MAVITSLEPALRSAGQGGQRIDAAPAGARRRQVRLAAGGQAMAVQTSRHAPDRQVRAFGPGRQPRGGDLRPRSVQRLASRAPKRDEEKPSIASVECDGVARPASRHSGPKAAPEPQDTISGRRPEVSSNAVVEAWAVSAAAPARRGGGIDDHVVRPPRQPGKAHRDGRRAPRAARPAAASA